MQYHCQLLLDQKMRYTFLRFHTSYITNNVNGDHLTDLIGHFVEYLSSLVQLIVFLRMVLILRDYLVKFTLNILNFHRIFATSND